MKRSRILGAVLAGIMAISGLPASGGLTEPLAITASAASKLAAPKNLKAAVSGTAVKLTWSKVSGADAYRVYKYNSSTKKYEKLKNVKSNSTSIKDLSKGTYKFKVAALVTKNGKYTVQTKSSAVSAKVTGSSSSSKLPITFPAVGTKKSSAISAMKFTEHMALQSDTTKFTTEVGIKKLSGEDCPIVMFFNPSGKFFYGIVMFPEGVTTKKKLMDAAKAEYGSTYLKQDVNGMTGYAWFRDNGNQAIVILSASDGTLAYGVIGNKYLPEGFDQNDINGLVSSLGI